MSKYTRLGTRLTSQSKNKLDGSFIPVVTMVTTLLVGQARVMPHVLSHSHLMKTSVDFAAL